MQVSIVGVGVKAGEVRQTARRSIPAEEYDRGFFLSPFLEGYQQFVEGELSVVKRRQLEMLSPEPGMGICEIGYGRGELMLHCAARGARVAGIDYSRDAYRIAQETLAGQSGVDLRLGDARDIPFPSDSFDRVFSGDVIEHLSSEDAVTMLREMWRITRPGGFLLVHTTPNTMFTKLVYPWARHILGAINPDAVRTIEAHLRLMDRYHIDEYNLFSLRRAAKTAGLARPRVWIDPDLMRSYGHWHTRAFARNPLVRLAGKLGRVGLFRFFLGNDLYLECSK